MIFSQLEVGSCVRDRKLLAGNATFKTVERRFHYCISGLHPDTSDEQVSEYVSTKVGAKVLEVELVANRFQKYSMHKMFKVTVPASDDSKMTGASNWVQNLSVKNFRMVPAPRQLAKLNGTITKSSDNDIDQLVE